MQARLMLGLCCHAVYVCLTVCLFVCLSVKKRKERKWIYIAPLLSYLTLKALRYGSHSVTCKLHRTCLYLVSIYQMTHPQTEVADI